jgi:hypothetical protein
VNVTFTFSPEQIVKLACDAVAFGVGFTTTVAVIDVPTQPFAVGVIVNVTVCGVNVVLVSVPEILPDPDAAIPVTLVVLLRVHVYVVPVTLPLKTMVWIAVAVQIVCDEGVAIVFGVGLTSTVTVIGVPSQPFADGVMVNVTVCGS